MSTRNPPWRPEEIAQLYELWNSADQPDATTIGGLIGRPRNSVLGRVFRMRDKEGEERWPMRGKSPERPIKARRQPAKPAKKTPEKIIVPAIPDRVTEVYGTRCHWTGCDEPKIRGNYCADHAMVMYQPQREARRW